MTVAGTFTYNPPATAVLAAGPQTLSEHFAPEDATDYNTPADQSITLVVNKDATTTVVAAPTSADYGQAVTITATVTSNVAGAGTPTGTVTFADSTTGVTLGAPQVGSNGTASVTVSNLPPQAPPRRSSPRTAATATSSAVPPRPPRRSRSSAR